MGRPTREVFVKLARDAVGGPNRPRYCANPAAFEAHDWVLDAMRLAYDQGRRDESDGTAIRGPAVKTCHAGDKCPNWPQCESCGPPRL